MKLLQPRLSLIPSSDAPLSPHVIRLETAEVDSLDSALPVSARNAKRSIERIHTIAVYQAALLATRLNSAYQLEKLFEQETTPGNAPMPDWGSTRSRLWDRWSRGESTIAWQLERNSKVAMQRLATIECSSFDFGAFVIMPFWRYLNPAPPSLADVISDCSLEILFSTSKGSSNSIVAISHDELCHAELRPLAAALTLSTSRYLALCALWRSLRCCVSPDHLGTYSRLYGAWLSCREILKSDPILGKVAGDLYRHTNRYFSTLEITYH